MRRGLRWLAGVALGLALLLGWGWHNARADPVVRTAAIRLPRWPAGAAPLRVALLSDIHVGSSTMGRDRLARIVDRVAALRPDLVLIAGDFIAGHAPADAAAAPGLRALDRLQPRFGTIAVPGNHDHWTGLAATTKWVRGAGVTVLRNGAVARGPLAIGGVDDAYTKHADPAATLVAMAKLAGARVLLSHSPDIVPGLPAGAPALVLAGHTHCAQVYLPWLFPPRVPSRFGERYRCGLAREGTRVTVVTAGLGTSIVPLRFGAPPDLWLLTLGP